MMRQLFAILLPLLLTSQLYSQEKAFNYREAEDKIAKYIYSSPDSTKAVIDYVLSQKNTP